MNNIGTNFEKENCCGCTACVAICGKSAISMQIDEQGFRYPTVNKEECSSCGLCLSVCPKRNLIIKPLTAAFAAKRTDKIKILSSTSGGFAAALSEKTIKDGGVVYGACYGNFPQVIYRRASTLDGIEYFKGSKYVESDPKDTFVEVANDLKNGLKVAYFATSCIINGLLNYLKLRNINTNYLITVDLICHGVPSPGVCKDYISWLSNGKRRILDFKFRTKKRGWGGGSKNFCATFSFSGTKNNTSVTKTESDTYKSRAFQVLFFSNNCLRPFCYSCPYAGKGRVADFTIADYWQIENKHPEFNDKTGVSLVFTNTDKATVMLPQIDGLQTIPSTIENACEGQGNMTNASPKSNQYEQFWADYHRYDFDYIAKKYGQMSWKYRIKDFIAKRILRRRK